MSNSESDALGKRAREMIEKMKQKKFEGKNLNSMFNMLAKNDEKPKNNIFNKLINKKPKEEKKTPPMKTDNDLLLEDEDDTIDKMEEEVKQLSFDNNNFDNEAEDLEGGSSSDNSSNFEGGDDTSDLDLLIMNQEAEEDDGESEVNEAEEYEFQLTAYTSQLFMRDLINVLRFDLSEISERCPKLVKRNFRLFDESLQRRVHLYEHIIHLAHGFCRPGFIKFVTHNSLLSNQTLHRVGKPYEPGYNRFYDA